MTTLQIIVGRDEKYEIVHHGSGARFEVVATVEGGLFVTAPDSCSIEPGAVSLRVRDELAVRVGVKVENRD